MVIFKAGVASMTLMSSTRFGQFWTSRYLQDDLWFYWSLLQVLAVSIKSA